MNEPRQAQREFAAARHPLAMLLAGSLLTSVVACGTPSPSDERTPPDLGAAFSFDSDGDGVYDVRDQCAATSIELMVDRFGCPLVGVVDGLQFAPGSADLSTDAAGVLDEIVPLLKRHAEKPFTIATHTDASGDSAINRDLSRRRAVAIARHLYDAGIPRERMTAIAFGESRPIASNDTPDGRRTNRRATILVKR